MENGNYVAYNLGLNPAVNFNFMLRVEGVFDLPCKAVHAFSKENEYEYIQEGGLNDYVHMRRKPISKPFTIQVERYVGVDMLDPLANGTELVLPLILYVNRYSVYKEFHPVRMYVFSGCTVIAKEYGELNAERSGLLVETTTIAYREMYTVENVAASFVRDDTWEFDELSKIGKGKRKAVTGSGFGVDEELKSNMEDKASLWEFDKLSKAGKGKRSAKTPEDYNIEEPSKAELEEEHSGWKFDKLSKEGNGKTKAKTVEDYKIEEKSKAELKEKAVKWRFKGGNSEKIQEEEAVKKLLDFIVGGKPVPDFVGSHYSSKSVATTIKSEQRKGAMEEKSKRYNFKNEGNGSAVKNKQELSKGEMDRKGKKYDIVMNSGKSAVGSDGSREKQAFEKKSQKYNFKKNSTGSAVTSDQTKEKSKFEGKARKYDIKKNSTGSAVTSDQTKEKSKFEGKAKKWPKESSAMTIEKFMTMAKLGK